jgi:hypothetical protein
MAYELVIHQRPTFLHAVVTGRNTRENVERYLEELQGECMVRKCFRLLIEERLDGPRLPTVDVFEIAMRASTRARATLNAVAYVDVHADADSMHFAETVAVNRSLRVAVFATVAEAERWLLSPERADAGSPVQSDPDAPSR